MTWTMWYKSIFLVVVLFCGIWSKPGLADWGVRVVRFDCDPKRKTIIVEPFIVWNDGYMHGGDDIGDLRTHVRTRVGTSVYYLVRNAYGAAIQETCNAGARHVKMRLKDKQLVIEETTVQATTYVHIDLSHDVGYAWDVWGPTYQLESTHVREWKGCFGREDSGTPHLASCLWLPILTKPPEGTLP